MNEKDAYRKLWSGDKTCEPYLHWLARGDEGLSAREPSVLNVVDVTISGSTEQYELVSPCDEVTKNDFFVSDEMQLWLQVTEQQLSTFKSEVETRIIIFSERSDVIIRNLLGTKYNVEPDFFASVQHQQWMTRQFSGPAMHGTGSLSWPAAYQTFSYATGRAVQHLKFENGFIACVVKDTTSAPDGRKNVGMFINCADCGLN